MADALALSIEEANKIRRSMGLAPLPVPGAAPAAAPGPAFKESNGNADADSDDEPASTIDTRQAAAYDNWKKLQDDADAKKRRDDRLAAIKKEREKASRSAKLDGKGLADEADDADDMAWLKGTKKRQKKIAKAEQMQRDLEERERQAQAALSYNETDLAGVKVAHELKDFDDGEDQVLVLKDTAVDADEDDELEAVALKEKERLQEKLDSKKRKRVYDPNDVDENGQGSILAQYDEEINGKKHKAFTLDGQGRTVEEAELEASGAAKPKKVAISLDILKDDTPANDYMDISEVKIKKPKKKKSKASRRKRTEDEDDMFAVDGSGAMEVDQPEEEPEPLVPKPKKNLFDTSFVDDDDLQANLAAQRQKALKKRKKMRPEEIARQLREEGSATPDVRDSTEAAEDEPGLVIDETTEFVQKLARSKSEEAEEERRRRKSSHLSSGIPPIGDEQHVDDDGDAAMHDSYAEAAEAEERAASRNEDTANLTGTGLDEEQTVDRGLGATLKLLKQRGVIHEADAEDMNAKYRDRQKFLADKQRAEEFAERQAKEQRERERNSTRWNSMTAREREEWSRKNNANRDQMESRKIADIFNKEYQPNIQLNYVDEHGRQMTQKEAFKQLSHQFHGKGSGNTKTQKHLDKIAAEKKAMASSSLETNLAGGMTHAQGQQSKKRGQAGVRLQ